LGLSKLIWLKMSFNEKYVFVKKTLGQRLIMQIVIRSIFKAPIKVTRNITMPALVGIKASQGLNGQWHKYK